MSSTIQPNGGLRMSGISQKNSGTKQSSTQTVRFLDMVAKESGSALDTLKISGNAEIAKTADASNMDAYMEHLKNKYGKITVACVKKDQASLEQAGGRMSGHDVVIAPNILEDMAKDAKKAGYYEQKIDNFFNAVPGLQAQFASKGLNYVPCGVIIHEDGSVTYMSGCGDSPERVAEVNAINNARDAKRAVQRKEYQEQAVTAAGQNRAMLEHIAETMIQGATFYDIGDLLKIQTAAATSVLPELSLLEGTSIFFLNL